MNKATDQISLNPTAVARALGAVALLLVLLSSGGQFSRFVLGYDYVQGLIPLFYVDKEQNVPTYFSVLLILLTALLLAIIGVLERKRMAPHASRWMILSFGFLFMAFDEAFEVHEGLIDPMRALLGDGDLGIFYFAWVIPGTVLVLFLGLYFLGFLRRLPASARRRFSIAAILYIGGAIGVELVGGRHAELHGNQDWIYSMIVTVEESLEMAGLVVFIWALLKYCADHYEGVHVQFEAQ